MTIFESRIVKKAKSKTEAPVPSISENGMLLTVLGMGIIDSFRLERRQAEFRAANRIDTERSS